MNTYYNPMHTFISHGRQYEIDEVGAIHQTDGKPFVYNGKYVSTYETPAYTAQSNILQALRLGFVLGAHGMVPDNIVDFGYGNGAFMKFAAQLIPDVYGYDVTDIEIPGCTILEKLELPGGIDVVTFWDALEHVPDLSFLGTLWATTLVISLPYCHFPSSEQQGWFDQAYIHRKPDEHLHHFNAHSLAKTMQKYWWEDVAWSYHEDIVRTSKHGRENILTGAFKRIKI